MKIGVEAQGINTGIMQCPCCQHFDHNQAKCKKSPRYVKCGKKHFTEQCSKTKSTQATCANCGRQHTPNYRDKTIDKKKRKNSKNQKQQQQIRTATSNLRDDVCFAKTFTSQKPNTNTNTQTKDTTEH